MVGDALHLLFSPNGRLGRGSYALGLMAASVVAILALLLDGVAFSGKRWTLWTVVVFGLFSYVSWCLHIKRAHDLGRSGWWLLGWALALPVLLLAMLLLIDHGVAGSGTLSFMGWMLHPMGISLDSLGLPPSFKSIDMVTNRGLAEPLLPQLIVQLLKSYLVASASLLTSVLSLIMLRAGMISNWPVAIILAYAGIAVATAFVSWRMVFQLHFKAGEPRINQFGAPSGRSAEVTVEERQGTGERPRVSRPVGTPVASGRGTSGRPAQGTTFGRR